MHIHTRVTHTTWFLLTWVNDLVGWLTGRMLFYIIERRTCRRQLRLCSPRIVHLTSRRLPLARCLWARCQRCSDWSPSNGKSIPQSDLEHSRALTGSAYRWQADAIHQCHRGVGGGGHWTLDPRADLLPHQDVTLRSLEAQSNKSNVWQ